MSNFPTLYELSLDVVVDSFKNGLLPTNHVIISPAVQKEVFGGVMKARDCYNDHTRALIKMFQPKKLELNLKKTKIGKFTEIQELKLTELKINNFESYSRNINRMRFPARIQQIARLFVLKNTLRIECFLDNILSHETKQNLRVLDISEEKSFEKDWMEELSSMFPNLEVLNISGREMSEEDFTSLCDNLPNLRYLDISSTGILSLDGISKLQNLEYLNIDLLVFDTKEDIEELFELKKLKQFIFSNTLNEDWNCDWFFEKPFPMLTTLVCRCEEADNDFLRRILPKLPKLQTVIACETEITQDIALPGVSVYTNETIESMFKTLGYFRSQGDWKEVVQIFEHFNEMCSGWNERAFTPEQMIMMVNELELIIRHFKLGKKVLPKEVAEFLRILLDLFNRADDLPNSIKLKMIDMIQMELRNHLNENTRPTELIFKSLWNEIEALVRTMVDFNVDKVCSLAMRSIIHGGGTLDWESLCAVMLDRFIDRMDLSSEYYESINYRMLHECLSTIQNRTVLLAEKRASAGNVLRFIELFM